MQTSEPETADVETHSRPTIGMSTISSSNGQASSGGTRCAQWPRSTTVRCRAGSRRVSGVASSADFHGDDPPSGRALPLHPTELRSPYPVEMGAAHQGVAVVERHVVMLGIRAPCRHRRHRTFATGSRGWRRRQPTAAQRSSDPSSHAGGCAVDGGAGRACSWLPAP